MLHPSIQAIYFAGIQACIDNYSTIHQFCDWLDENNIRSQQWQEVRNMLHMVKYIWENKKNNTIMLVTKHKHIMIGFSRKTKKITLTISKRANTLTNKILSDEDGVQAKFGTVVTVLNV